MGEGYLTTVLVGATPAVIGAVVAFIFGWRRKQRKAVSQRQDEEQEEKKWAKENDEIKPDNVLWKQYIVFIDLFKFYVDITWKGTTWFYAITGAILVYYFDHLSDNNPYLSYSLALPIALSFGLAAIYHRGLRETHDLNRKLKYISEHLHLPGKPHVDILARFLRVARLLYLFIGSSLLIVILLSFFSFP